jgi:N-acetylmuramoyl-L-alanine amidase
MKWMLILAMAGVATADEPRQMTVVVDAGHGGSNTGAPGRVAGAYEKQITLAVARALGQRLERDGVKVVMTRERDQYLTLRERARLANAARPDCFVSIHTNASPEHARHGGEVYVLARETTEVEARRAASRQKGVDALLAELSQLDAQRSSVGLASALAARLDEGQTKQAGYDVLSGVQAPAVLVEIGFIDHPIEGVQLLRPEVQKRIGEALAEGVFDFLSTRKPARYAAAPNAPRRPTE